MAKESVFLADINWVAESEMSSEASLSIPEKSSCFEGKK